MPTTTNTYSLTAVDPIRNPEDAMASMQVVSIKASSTLAAGTVIGKVTATGRYAAYASGNSDGTQIPVGILRRGVVTDGSGNITNYSEWGLNGLGAPMFTQGDYLIADLTGLDDNAVAVLNGRVDGNGVANATVFSFGG